MSSKVFKATRNATKGSIKNAAIAEFKKPDINIQPGTSTGIKRRPGRPKKNTRNSKRKCEDTQSNVTDVTDTQDGMSEDDEGEEDSVDSEKTQIKPKVQQMPPIVVTQNIKNVKEFYDEIKQNSKAETIHFKSYKDTKQIITYNKTDYSEIQKYLESKQILFYAYTLKEDKPKKLCLKGIDKSYDVTDIHNDILKLSTEVIKVVQLKSLKDKKELLNVYLVHFKSTCDLNEIVKTIRYLCDHKVKWEPYHKSRKNMVTQCNRCQRFGHASNNCNHPFRCIKCISDHEVGQCKITKEDKPACVNCSLEHPANYRNCKVYKEYIKDKKKQSRRPQPDKFTTDYNKYEYKNIGSNINKNSATQYSTVIKGHNNAFSNSQFDSNTTQQSNFTSTQQSQIITQNQPKPVSSQPVPASNSSNFNFILNEIKQLFGMTINQLNDKIKNFLPNYLSETDIQQKKILLLGFLIETQVFD